MFLLIHVLHQERKVKAKACKAYVNNCACTLRKQLYFGPQAVPYSVVKNEQTSSYRRELPIARIEVHVEGLRDHDHDREEQEGQRVLAQLYLAFLCEDFSQVFALRLDEAIADVRRNFRPDQRNQTLDEKHLTIQKSYINIIYIT